MADQSSFFMGFKEQAQDEILFMHIFAYAEFGLSIKMIKFAGFLVKLALYNYERYKSNEPCC